MSETLAPARAPDPAFAEWLAGYFPPRFSTEPTRYSKTSMESAFRAGREAAEADHAVELAVGQRTLDEAVTLIRDAAELFRSYEAQHRERADPNGNEYEARLRKAERNAAIAKRLEAWLRGDHLREFVRVETPGEDTAVAHGQPKVQLNPGRHFTHSPGRYEGGPCRVDHGNVPNYGTGEADRTREDCESRFVNVVTFIPPAREPDLAAMRRFIDSNLRPAKPGVMAALIGEFGRVLGLKGEAPPHRPEGVADLAAFRVTTADPRFDPAAPVCVNGFLYHPAKEA